MGKKKRTGLDAVVDAGVKLQEIIDAEAQHTAIEPETGSAGSGSGVAEEPSLAGPFDQSGATREEPEDNGDRAGTDNDDLELEVHPVLSKGEGDGQEDRADHDVEQDQAASGQRVPEWPLDAGIPTDAGTDESDRAGETSLSAGDVETVEAVRVEIPVQRDQPATDAGAVDQEQPERPAEVQGAGSAAAPAEGQADLKARPKWENNVVAAMFAASHAHAYDLRLFSVGFMGLSWHDNDLGVNEDRLCATACVAAKFIRENPEAPASAVPIHLKLSGFRDVPTDRRELVAWRIFAFTLRELDELDRTIAAESAAATPSPAGAWPGDRAMMPEPGGFAPTGYDPRR